MSVSRDARDTASALYYQKALETLRDRHLERSLAGEDLTGEYWEQGEKEALEATRREFFNLKARKVFLPDRAESISDEEDFRARTTPLMEMGALETHRILASLPWVGHPDFHDPEGKNAGGTTPGDHHEPDTPYPPKG